MIVHLDAARVGKLLIKIEAGLHRSGWDNPELPTLVTLERTAAGLRSVKVPVPIGDPPGEYLLQFAQLLAQGNTFTRRIISSLATPSFYGTAFVMESWMIEVAKGEDRSARPRYLGDDPNRIEARTLMALTVTGQIVFLLRRRGQKPFITEYGEHGGRVARALLIINKLVAAVMPDGEQYLKDLDAVGLTTTW